MASGKAFDRSATHYTWSHLIVLLHITRAHIDRSATHYTWSHSDSGATHYMVTSEPLNGEVICFSVQSVE